MAKLGGAFVFVPLLPELPGIELGRKVGVVVLQTAVKQNLLNLPPATERSSGGGVPFQPGGEVAWVRHQPSVAWLAFDLGMMVKWPGFDPSLVVRWPGFDSNKVAKWPGFDLILVRGGLAVYDLSRVEP